MNENAAQRPCALVTGAAGGLGAAAVRRFIDGGWRVAAADLKAPTGFRSDDVLPVAMDIRDTASVEAGMDELRRWAPDGIDALVTFAAVGGIGPLMETSVEDMATVMDVNVVGTHRTVLAAWEHVRKASGRIVLIGSETGAQHAFPLNGPYAASKHAIEAYADALRRELMFVGVPVVLMQPGPFRTAMLSRVPSAFAAVPAESPFKPLTDHAIAHLAGAEKKASDPEVLADAVFDAATSARPRTRYPVRVDRGRALLDLLPVGVVDRVLKSAIGSSVSTHSQPLKPAQAR
ncbi:MAG: SDR family NAD(P)-dependent oxidoreductase [Dermatophilus congolensis]|nr:SDR family NAD(P)-dependent oxidoreductase [Dermatophilus congolensis]